ncbi:uncharacterized protein [Triticum aestivum]|uniref:uncharacterized protein isoform X4 n=1 Tax=Triticum aestivum TaxID=4565 RepID=UPI001D034021|nr:uncharacterized protein LOC123058871 isoform X4 [Triticum aestivum]
MDDNLFVPLLPKLAATLVTISRKHMLQLSVNALRVTASQSVHYDEDDGSFFATVEIHVPAHENIPQFKTTIFAGHNCQTTNAAHESVSTAALHYMQQAGILIIDDLNFPELQKCKKEVVRAKSWSDIFGHETVKLKRKIGSLERELASLKENSVVHKPIQQPQATEEPDQQVSIPPYEHHCTELFTVANKPKENNKGDGPFLSATTSAHKLPSSSARTLTRKHGVGARRTLFATKEKATNA